VSHLFSEAMEEFTTYQMDSILKENLFLHCDSICDIAGGNGALLSAIREIHSNKSIVTILVDSSEAAIIQAKRHEFSGYYQIDLFDEDQMRIPLSQCECILTKGIISDLPIEKMRSYLSLLSKFMSRHGTMFLLDHFLFPVSNEIASDSEIANSMERFKLEMSLMLYALLGSRQYSVSEMIEVANTIGLNVTRIQQTSSPLVVIVLQHRDV
jgi:hypothetical protein